MEFLQNIVFAITGLGVYLALLAIPLSVSWALVRITTNSIRESYAQLVAIIILAQLVTLIHAAFFPATSSIFVIGGSLDAYVRGWPLAWLGLRSLEVVLLPFYIAINWLFWTVIGCLTLFLSISFVRKLNAKFFNLAYFFTLAVVVVLSLFLPRFFLPWNTINLVR